MAMLCHQWHALVTCYVSLVLAAAAAVPRGASPVDDAESLVQHLLAPRAGSGTEAFDTAMERLLSGDANVSRLLLQARQNNQAFVAKKANRAYLTNLAEVFGKSFDGRLKTLSSGWRAFEKKGPLASPDPQILLQTAKAALLETGALEQMRQMAVATANASKTLTEGAVPLDSMLVGFKTSLAPWNNLLKEFALPLIKSSFTLFSNFFGPEGNAARLCVGAMVAADSTYFAHRSSEFGGINLFVGPAKWDNVPGWSFGASGGIDDMKFFDVADFGWSWTLAQEPETVCFHFDICVIDSEGLKVSTLQTNSELQGREGVRTIPVHGSTWLGHTWCSPDWENTPLVIPDLDPLAAASAKEEPEASEPFFKKSEEWDPDADAV